MYRLGVRYPYMPPIWEDRYQLPPYKTLHPNPPLFGTAPYFVSPSNSDELETQLLINDEECPASIPLSITVFDEINSSVSQVSPLSPHSPQTKAAMGRLFSHPPPPPSHKRQSSGSACFSVVSEGKKGDSWISIATPSSHRSSVMSSPSLVNTPPSSPLLKAPTEIELVADNDISYSYSSYISLGMWLPKILLNARKKGE